MASADVKFRLSVEGEQQITAAMRRVLAESQRTGAQAGRSFRPLGAALTNIKGLLGAIGLTLGITAAVAAMRSLATAALETGDRIAHFGEIAGIESVEHIEALQLAATRTDVSLEQLQRGIVRVSEKVSQAKAGVGAGAAAFHQLGISADEIRGKDTAEVIGVLSQKMGELADSTEKTGRFAKIFGNRMGVLIPMFNELGRKGGLAGFMEEAQRLGILVSRDLIDGAHALGQELKVVKLQIDSLALRFMGGLAPAVVTALREMEGELGSDADMWQEWGRRVGYYIAYVMLGLENLADAAKGALEILKIDLQAMGDIVLAAGRKEYYMVGVYAMIAKEREKQVEADFEKRRAARLKTLDEIAKGKFATWPDRGATKTADQVKAEADAAISAAEAGLKPFTAALKAREDLNKRLLDSGLVSMKEYFAERLAIVNEGYEAERRVAEKRLDTALQEEDPTKALAAEAKARAEIEVLDTEHAAAVQAIIFEEADANRRLSADKRKYLSIEEGERAADHAQRMTEIREEERAYRVLLVQMGETPDVARAMAAQRRTQREAAERVLELQRKGQEALRDLSLDEERIQTRIDAGLESQIGGHQKILDLYRRRLPVLRALAELEMTAARVSKDPDRIRDAEEYGQAVERISVALEAQTNVLAQVKAAFADAATSALTDFFARGITEAKRLTDALLDMVRSVVSAVRQMLSQKLAEAIVGWILSIGKSKLMVAREGGLARGYAGGGALVGLVRGVGGSRDDRILARLSDREFVVRSKVVKEPGALSFLQAFNRSGMFALRTVPGLREFGGVPRFAEGGLAVAPGAALDRASASIEGMFTLALEDGLVERRVARWIESPAGSRVMVRAYSKNKHAIGRVLGKG